jgi:hypothetical protein
MSDRGRLEPMLDPFDDDLLAGFFPTANDDDDSFSGGDGNRTSPVERNSDAVLEGSPGPARQKEPPPGQCQGTVRDGSPMPCITVLPRENDVLCGRGKAANRHAGNRRYLELVRGETERYGKSASRLEKRRVAEDIVRRVRDQTPPGRFLKKDPGTGLWGEVGNEGAIEKTMRALHDRSTDRRPLQVAARDALDCLDSAPVRTRTEPLGSRDRSPSIKPLTNARLFSFSVRLLIRSQECTIEPHPRDFIKQRGGESNRGKAVSRDY